MNRTVLVTGASRGIGRAIAKAFAGEGDRVAINYRQSRDEAETLKAELLAMGVQAMTVCADVGNGEQVTRMFEQVEAELGAVEVLVNNAGIARQALLTGTNEAEWDELFAVNVKSAFLCARAALPSMIRRQEGKIVNISSMWGISGASCEVAYSASKAALIGFTKALAKEVGPSNIHVNCVAPGVVDTQMNALLDERSLLQLREETPLCRIGTPEEIAAAVVFLASPAASFITGQVLAADGGMVI